MVEILHASALSMVNSELHITMQLNIFCDFSTESQPSPMLNLFDGTVTDYKIECL